MNKTNFFFLGLILAASGIIGPPVALGAGLTYGLIVPHPYQLAAKRLSQFLLQASVVALGFGMNLHQVLRVGRSGLGYTALSIVVSMLIGTGMGRLLRVGNTASFLISVGTAICGGSAIAAVGPITRATDEEMAVSLGTVFVLNSVALLTFPSIGWLLHLSETQFGLWSALAIHDTSSVVGAAAKYGSLALGVATTVKLTRALWIVPLSLVTALVSKNETRQKWPWFILFFCLAAVANTYISVLGPAYPVINHLGKIGLTVTLYLIGTGLSKDMLRKIGVRPLLQGALLWIVVTLSSLVLVRTGWIHL
jgi:uncharacterized integral membrane protein (TIGR00698 family)